TKALRSIVAYFADGQVRTNALKPVSLNATTAWSLATDTVFSIADNMLSVTMPEGNTVPTDTLNGVKDGYTKSFAISAIPNILKGEGSESSPFLLETADDWYKLADFMFETKYEYPASYFRMVNDLDFNGQEIRLIAVNGTKFGGVFDGNGKTVKNYTYTNNNSTSTATSWKEPHLYRGATIGLFGTIAAEGVLKNLIADGQFNAYTNIGAIAGEVYGRVENCEHKGTVYATSTGVGGIAYRLQDGGSIVNCVNSGNVTNKTTYVAGIVHTVNEGGIVENCVNTGNVTPGTTGAFGIAYTFNGCGKNLVNKGALKATGTIAGICNTLGKDATLDSCSNEVDILMGEAASTVCGLVNNTTANSAAAVGEPTSWIKNCYNTGNISGKNSVFGLANTIKNGVLLEDCYNTGDISSVTTYGAYGIAGAVTSNNKPELQPTVIRRVWN
ncbi:MAG: hypothetical protein K2M65_02205, partial [Muribaculaceae bacterium]|nr:hypothetical protein [Muribaculaceae bacterium]